MQTLNWTFCWYGKNRSTTKTHQLSTHTIKSALYIQHYTLPKRKYFVLCCAVLCSCCVQLVCALDEFSSVSVCMYRVCVVVVLLNEQERKVDRGSRSRPLYIERSNSIVLILMAKPTPASQPMQNKFILILEGCVCVSVFLTHTSVKIY